MKTIRPKILVSINAAECENFFCLSDFCPVNKSVCCLRELDRDRVRDERRIYTGGVGKKIFCG